MNTERLIAPMMPILMELLRKELTERSGKGRTRRKQESPDRKEAKTA